MSKHKQNTVTEDELPIIALDYKKRPAKENGFQTKGWKFYLRIKELIPDWWYDFNGNIKSNGKVRYRDIASFAKKKLRDKEEIQYLVWMISPRKVYEREAINNKRYCVPWLGDWKARRRTGRWETENKENIRYLRNAIKENVQASQAIRAASPFLVQNLLRWTRLKEKVDDLFDGEPFLDDSPTNKHNLTRFKLYTSMHEEIERLQTNVIHEWMRIHGVDPKDPHGMWDMATMAQMVGQSAAAGALTGYVAGNGLQPLNGQDGKPNGDNVMQLNGQGIVISPDALLLASHLTKHSKTFNKPLPAIVEGEVVEKVNGKSNGHVKAN